MIGLRFELNDIPVSIEAPDLETLRSLRIVVGRLPVAIENTVEELHGVTYTVHREGALP